MEAIFTLDPYCGNSIELLDKLRPSSLWCFRKGLVALCIGFLCGCCIKAQPLMLQLHIHVYMHIHVQVHMSYVYIYVYIYIHILLNIYCIYTHTYIHKYIHTYYIHTTYIRNVHTYIHTSIHTYICVYTPTKKRLFGGHWWEFRVFCGAFASHINFDASPVLK